MAHFFEYMRGLAERRGLRKTIEGGVVQYRFSLPLGALIEVTCHDLDPSFTCLVRSEAWPAPLNATEQQNFMRAVLKANRSALSVLHAGVIEDFENPALYRLTWFVPRGERIDSEWFEGLLEFDKLYQAFQKVLRHTNSLTNSNTGGQANTIAQGQYQIFMP
jgi:hypothetical protein